MIVCSPGLPPSRCLLCHPPLGRNDTLAKASSGELCGGLLRSLAIGRFLDCVAFVRVATNYSGTHVLSGLAFDIYSIVGHLSSADSLCSGDLAYRN